MLDYLGILITYEEINGSEKNILIIFSHPVNLGINVFTKSKYANLRVFDTNGSLVEEGYNTNTINTEKLVPGLYFVSNGLQQAKLIVIN